uniref:Uncharacterized protein n=1 Tax=Tanacetum cinerariifolium TaxID=118510 RepID=A0A699GXD7_TANCI|nr:hypothetical protein [Tanacetum cinerariifolium]
MDDLNITMEEYIRLEEEKARRRAIVFDDVFTSEVTPSYEPTVEETLLALCYVAVFEDGNVGASQKKETFWRRPRVGHEELFGEDARPRLPGPDKSTRPSKKRKSDTTTSIGRSNSSNPFSEHMLTEFRLKREAAEKAYDVSKEKDCTLMHLEEMKFLATSTEDLSEDDAYCPAKTNDQRQI